MTFGLVVSGLWVRASGFRANDIRASVRIPILGVLKVLILPEFIRYPFQTLCPENMDQMKILCDKYSQTMKSFNVTLRYLTTEELKTCIECIARFENLKELKLNLVRLKTTQPIDECLSLIGQKCNKLLKLDSSIDFSIPISDRFFQVFTEFRAIKKLKITLGYNMSLNGSIECFKQCKQLNEIHINYSELTEDFFCKHRVICTETTITYNYKNKKKENFETFIDSLHSMKK